MNGQAIYAGANDTGGVGNFTSSVIQERTAFDALMAEHDTSPDVMLADCGYDSDAIRDRIRARGGQPETPTTKNRCVQHSVNQMLYATHNRIERFSNRLKNSRRVAIRYDLTGSSFLSSAKLATIKQWFHSVRAT